MEPQTKPTEADRTFYESVDRAFEVIERALAKRAAALGFAAVPTTARGRPFGSRNVRWHRGAEMLNLCQEGRDHYLALGYSRNRHLQSPISAGYYVYEVSSKPSDYDGVFSEAALAKFLDAIEHFSPQPSA
jgi:hypothetical protein